jgi:hypothetical protein
MRILRTGLTVVALSLCLAGARTAEAGSRSWDVARSVLPGDVQALAGANVASIQKTALYQQLLPLVLARNAEMKQHLDTARSACGMDLTSAVVDVTAALRADEKGLIVLALHGVDQAKVLSCFQAVAARDKSGKVTAKTNGAITTYTHAGGTDALYLAWLAKDVVAFASDPHDQALLRALIGGKGASGDAAAGAGRINTSSAGWAVVAKSSQPEPGITIKGGYGTLDDAGGAVTVDVHVTAGSAAEAKSLAEKANQQVDQVKKTSQAPPELAGIFKGLKIANTGSDVRIQLSLPEKQVLALIGTIAGQI